MADKMPNKPNTAMSIQLVYSHLYPNAACPSGKPYIQVFNQLG